MKQATVWVTIHKDGNIAITTYQPKKPSNIRQLCRYVIKYLCRRLADGIVDTTSNVGERTRSDDSNICWLDDARIDKKSICRDKTEKTSEPEDQKMTLDSVQPLF